MAPKRAIAYTVALITSLAYSVWYIGSSMLVGPLRGTYALAVPLFMIEVISASFMLIFMVSRPHGIRSGVLIYPVLSGVFYTAANLVLYFIIRGSGIPAASSFASAEIVIFTLLLMVSAKNKVAMSFYSIGSVLIASGLILESLRLSGGVVMLNATLIGEGVFLAVIAGVATYFFYLSTAKIENKFTTMFVAQFTEVLLYGALILAVYKNIAFPSFSLDYILLTIGVGVALMLSFYLETTMMKLLVPLGKGAVSTGYILSDLQLLPVLAYALIMSPPTWIYYAPGLVLITIGMAFLEWG